MRIRDYKELVGLSIAQARAAFEKCQIQNDLDYKQACERWAAFEDLATKTLKALTEERDALKNQVEDLQARIQAAPVAESKASLRKVWRDLRDDKDTDSDMCVWYARRQRQLSRLAELGLVRKRDCYWHVVGDVPPAKGLV